jgi:hypothetical protein
MQKSLRQIKNWCAIFIFTMLMLPNSIIGQHYFRMKADFSIKEKFGDGKMSLTMGTLYYDRNYKKLVYDVKFPQKETWVIKDTIFYKIVKGELIQQVLLPLMPNTTIFDFALNNNMDNFGLEKSPYKINKIENEKDMVISTWLPDPKMAKALGKIVISKKKAKLFGIAFYTPKNELVKKQLFKGFLTSAGVTFPEEITEILYKQFTKETKLTTFKNLKVNEMKDENFYNFTIPRKK